MAKQLKKAQSKEAKKEVLPKYKLIRDYPTSNGVKKAGTYIEANDAARKILTKLKFI